MDESVNIKQTPDAPGYYWAKMDSGWVMVEAYFENGRYCIKTFGGRAYYATYSKEYLGPLTPGNVRVYKTVPA